VPRRVQTAGARAIFRRMLRRPLTHAPGRAAGLAALATVALLGCAGRQAAPAVPPITTAWRTSLHRDHPLVGRVWDVRAGRFVAAEVVLGAVARGRFVLLGETHDNPDHHLLQARLLEAVTGAGRRPALAFEMLDASAQGAVDAVLAGGAPTADQLRDAVGWDQSGWPPFEEYRPIFEVGLAARLPVVAANLSRAEAREVIHRGEDALAAPVRQLLDRAGPLPAAEATERGEEMAASHCGQLPERFLAPMVLSQRARDAQLARALVAAAGTDGAVLITGAEHARRDRAVPAFLGVAGIPAGEVVSVALREVDPAGRAPADYAPLPFDYVIFTPAAAREDPCKDLKPMGSGTQVRASR